MISIILAAVSIMFMVGWVSSMIIIERKIRESEKLIEDARRNMRDDYIVAYLKDR